MTAETPTRSAGGVGAGDGRMSLVEHLKELRNRLGKSLLAVTVCVIVAFIFWEPLFEVLQQPYQETTQGSLDDNLYSFGPIEQFALRLRVSFLVGVVSSAPVWLYQFGAFITPALHKKEKRYAGGFLVASLTLFVAGTIFAFLTLSRGLEFLLDIGGSDITSLLSAKDYLSFVTMTLLAFGVAFEFPVLVMFLHLVGVFPSSKMRAWRRGMIVGLFAVAAVITPSQDPFTFVFLAVPLYLLYEVCILAARLRERAARRRAGPESTLDDDVPSYVDTRPAPLDDGRLTPGT